MKGKIEKIVYINGYWLDTKETFKDYKCYIGAEYEGEQDDAFDKGIFYWFEDQADFDHFLQTAPDFSIRSDSEFVITSFTEETYNA